MVEIGGQPILWHIMKLYSSFGMSHFVIALGYKGDMIKSYFLDYRTNACDLSIRTLAGELSVLGSPREDWTVDLVDTGYATNTGGRVRRLAPHLPDESFCLSYGDCLTNADLRKAVDFHRDHGRLVTLMAVRPPARFGWLELDGSLVTEFVEKPDVGEGWVNGGFMVLRREVLELIESDDQSLELDIIAPLAVSGEVMAMTHTDFWHPMDTLKDVRVLRSLWDGEAAQWRLWD
jgi:glucose-1-phosphate cytidylyltransferase